MNPLPELFLAPFVGPHHSADVALPATHAFAGPAVWYNGRPERVEFVQAALADAGVPDAHARAFLSTSVPAAGAALGILADVGDLVSRIWNPDQHPRDEGGRFGPGGAGGRLATGGALPAAGPDVTRALTVIDRSLKASDVGGERGREYRAAAASVLGAMSPGALVRFNAHVKSVHYLSRFEDVTPAVATRLRKLGVKGAVPPGICGAFMKGDGTLVIDGGVPGTRPDEGVHAAGVFAHEAGHVIDGPRDEISSSPEWKTAWTEEILNGRPPSEYAKVSPAEGFAEMHRLLAANRRAAERMYPACAQVWRSNGLL